MGKKINKKVMSLKVEESIDDLFAEVIAETVELEAIIESAIVEEAEVIAETVVESEDNEMTELECECYIAQIPEQVINYLLKINKIKSVNSARTIAKIDIVDNCPEVKVGQLANKNLRLLIPTLSADCISNLLSASYCKENFNLSYPILTMAIANDRKPERYYTGTVSNGSLNYYITSEWFIKNKPYLLKFLQENEA